MGLSCRCWRHETGIGGDLGWYRDRIGYSRPAHRRPETRFSFAMDNEPTQPCPFCGESIRVTARACPYCGQDLKDMPSAMPLHAPSDTAAWLELFEQPERVSPATEPLIKPLRYRRSLREILATGPRTIGEAAYGIADMLGMQALVYHEAIRDIVEHLGMEQAWALALQVQPLPLRRRRRAFLERVRRKQAPPDAAQKS
jgi:hypothetical protein